MARSDRLAVRATLRQWRVRAHRTTGDIAYLVYAGVLVSVIVLVPILRAAWLLLSEPAMIVALSSPASGPLFVAGALALMAAACAPWASPAVRPAFLARVLSESVAPLSVSLRGPVVRWWLIAVLAAVAVAALCQGVLWNVGISSGATFAWTVASAASTATIATALAVTAQRSALVSNVSSGALVAVAVAVIVMSPPVFVFAEPVGALPLVVLAVLAVSLMPRLLDGLHPQAIVAASVRRDATAVGVVLMDSGTVADAAHEVPQGGRRLVAVPRIAPWMTYSVAAMVGALRTPARLIRGVALLVAALALASVASSAWGVTAAAVLAYAGLGACMTGVRQAALAVRTTAVYGISDVTLVALHAIFPTIVVVVASTAGLVGGGIGWSVALVVGVASLLARIFAALTPPAPIALIMPVPTPVGDLAALLRLGWALQGAGFAVALSLAVVPAALGADLLRFVWAPLIALALLVVRWRNRG